MKTPAAAQPTWTSRFAFLMASIGFAVGLGNIWRFPYVTGENGGGAFVLTYLAFAVAIGVPILLAEIMIGRAGRASPPRAMGAVARKEGSTRPWFLVGGMNLLAAFMIMITYSVVAGWVLEYFFRAVTTGFVGMDQAASNQAFSEVLASPTSMLTWTLAGLTICGLVIYAGIENGIERAVKVMMPTLFVLMFALVIYNIFVGGFGEAVTYLFTADFSKIDGNVMLAALGQAFFSIGVAMAGMMNYGSYLPDDVSIPRSGVIIVFADTFVAILAGLVIFPIVFANDLDPSGGAGLIFQTLPVAFAGMPGGYLVAVVFFLLLSFAALTSMIGLIEPITHWAEEKWQWSRHRAAVTVIGAIGALSVISVLAYNLLSELRIGSMDINAALDFVSNQLLLPLGGLCIALFAGWALGKETIQSELRLSDGLFSVWRFLIRWIAPPAVAIILVLGVAG